VTNQRDIPTGSESHVMLFPDPIQVNAGETLTVVYTVGFGPECQGGAVCRLEGARVTSESGLVVQDFDYLNGL